MRVNDSGRVASLRCGLVLVGVCREMVAAKCVAESVGFAGYFRLLAEFDKVLLKSDFVKFPEFAGVLIAEWFKPSREGRADFHKSALPSFAFCGRNFDVTGDSPHVRPIKPGQFDGAESRQPAKRNHRAHGVIGSRQQRGQFAGGVKLSLGGVGMFRAQLVGFIQTVCGAEIVFADAPLQELPHSGAVVVAGLGREIAQPDYEGVQMALCEITDGCAGESVGKFVQLQPAVVGEIGG